LRRDICFEVATLFQLYRVKPRADQHSESWLLEPNSDTDQRHATGVRKIRPVQPRSC
jgi:hypothetical protein